MAVLDDVLTVLEDVLGSLLGVLGALLGVLSVGMVFSVKCAKMNDLPEI